ncbi:hypothetical protein [Helicobacter pylori]|nr:hypothetical protein [Helicobacter pylori]MBH0279820.1 hypothetical protein [Helicobacter pylori]MBH0302110.1 hypothetical protein [Helicobacter pylori]
MIKKSHPPSQKEKSFSLGTFGTYTASFKCFYQVYQGLEQRFSKPRLE